MHHNYLVSIRTRETLPLNMDAAIAGAERNGRRADARAQRNNWKEAPRAQMEDSRSCGGNRLTQRDFVNSAYLQPI
jgi:hypothetical protein